MANLAPFCPNGSVQVSAIVDCDGKSKNDWITREVIHAAWCWKLTLTDGTVLGFTSHDQDITYSKVVYEAATGFIPSAVATSNDMAVDTLEVQGYIKSDRISDADLISGRFDMAKIEVFIVNWANLTDKIVYVRKGTIGEIKYGQVSFTADLRGMLDVYQAKAGMIYQKLCRAKFGDTKCKADVTAYTATGTVTELYGDGNIETDLSQATAFFNYGVLKWTSGKNINLKIEVKYYTLVASYGGVIQPFISSIWPPAVGDTFTVTAGCDGNFSTCKTRGNYLNFRGEPFVPGNDYMSSYPTKGSGNTTTSGANSFNASYSMISCTGGENTYSYVDTNGVTQYTNQNCTVVTIQVLCSIVTDVTQLAYKVWAPWVTYQNGENQGTMGLNNSYVGSSDALAPVNEGATELETTSTWQHTATTGAWTKVQVNSVDYWQAPARTLLTAQPVGQTFQICCKVGAGADAANIVEINGGCPTSCDCVRPMQNTN
jgi:uncharacterized phage protein (TIGR02218 family)